MTRSCHISLLHAGLAWVFFVLIAAPPANVLAQQSRDALALEVILAQASPPPLAGSPSPAPAGLRPLAEGAGRSDGEGGLADTNVLLGLTRTDITLTNGNQLLALSFFSDSNHNYVVEFRDDIEPDLCNNWQPLTNAPHNYGIVFTDNNASNRFFRLRRIDIPRSPIFALLANDTGTNSLDGLTSDPTITGLALEFPQGTLLEASLDNPTGPFTTIINLGEPRYFHITRAGLSAINGAPLADGPHTLYLRAKTPSGVNLNSEFALPFTLDTTAPDTTITNHPPHPSSNTLARFAFTGNDALTAVDQLRFECRLLGTNLSTPNSRLTNWFVCSSPQTFSNLNEGEHTFEVRAIGLVCDVDPTPAAYTWFVDLTPPETYLVVRPPRITNGNSAVIEWTNSEPANTQCRLDGGAWMDCSSPVVLTNLPDGVHQYEIQPIDSSGNPGSITSLSWTNDYTGPVNMINTCPLELSNGQTQVFDFFGTDNFTAPGNLIFECRYMSPRTPPESTNWSRCTSPVTLTNLADGTNMFEVRAIDEAGNVDPTPAKCTWVVAVPPDTFITSGPPTNALVGTARFEFNGTDNATPAGNLIFQCRLDGGPPLPCSSPQTFSKLNDGTHTFAVWAIDEAGNADSTPATYNWNVNTARIRAWPFSNYDERGTRSYPPARTDLVGRPFQVMWQASGVAGALTGDLDGDGLLEVVTSDGSSIRIYSPTGTLLNTLTNVTGLNILADVTGDGNPEILVSGISGSTVWIRAYSRTGTLVRTFSKGGATDTGVYAWMGGDLNNDGTNEIVVQVHSGFSRSIRGPVIFNAATGAEVGFLNTGPFVRGPVSVGDINGDGTREILHGSGGPANGKTGTDGSSDSASYVWLLRANATTVWRRGPFNSGGFFDSSAMMADLDHDGAMDVIACSSSHGFGFWDGTVGRVMLLDPANGNTRADYDRNIGRPVEVIAVGDLETGGSDEIVVLHKDGGAQKFYLRVLRATPGLPDVAVLDMGTQASAPTLSDIDGDGQVEMLVSLGNFLKVFHISGSNLVQKWVWNCEDFTNRPVHTPIVSDLDGNGVNEIIVSCGNSAADYGLFVLSVIPNRPPVFTSAPVTQTSVSTNVLGPRLIDLTRWSVVQFPTTDQSGSANWTLSAGNTVARQSVNSEASAFVSDFSITNATFEGFFRIDTGSDDDWIGFVFFYTDDRHFHLLDWSQGGENNIPQIRLRAVHSTVPVDGTVLNASTDASNISTLLTKDVGWADRTDYRFSLQQGLNTLSIAILGATNEIIFGRDTFGPQLFGRVGFYSYSQEQTVFSGFTRTDPPVFNYVYQANATDPEGDSVTYALINGPTNMTIVAHSGFLFWNPTPEQVGDHNVTIAGSDSQGASALQSFIVTVLPAPSDGFAH